MIRLHSRLALPILGLALLFCFAHASGASALSSYASGAIDTLGSTGSAAVGLGAPDYEFVNDSGIGLAGNTDVFDVGEVAVFSFPTALRAIVGEHDLIVSAYVGGLGQTDNASVQVEVSSDGSIFTLAGTFATEDARGRAQDAAENDHAGVKHFWIEFAGADNVTHVRLTNLSGTVEGLRLDSIEGRQPDVDATHAFEIRLERYRLDSEQRFAIRIKNIADVGGVPIRELRIDAPSGAGFGLVDTIRSIGVASGSFICIEGCSLVGGVPAAATRQAWSTDGASEAAPGLGLDPGREVAHILGETFKAITPLTTYLTGFTFTITFTDGVVQVLDYDNDVLIEEGQLYKKYPYLSATPSESGPRPVDFVEWRLRSNITFSDPFTVGVGHTPGVGGRLISISQNFVEDGIHLEGMWKPNDSTSFVAGHFHDLQDGFERSHGFESSPGFGPDRQGIYLERTDGGSFDLESLEYRPVGPLAMTTLLISPTYDPSLPIAGQFTEFVVPASATFETLEFSQFDGVSSLFILAELGESQLERMDWDNFVIRTPDPVTIAPIAVAGADQEITDLDDDGIEVISVDGSASSDLDGTLATWTWIDAGLDVGLGPMVDIPFAVGQHHVTLRVLDDDGNPGLDEVQIQVNPPGGLPFADAGPNINVVADGMGNAAITLDGSNSFDSNGSLTSWVWTEFSVPHGSGETLPVSLSVGVHVIELEVTDNAANTATCTVTVSVTPLGGFPPIANAGSNTSVTDLDLNGFETVTLDASGSTDPDDAITSWSWSEEGTPLGSGEMLASSFALGVHSVDLVVQDAAGNTGVSMVTITVETGTPVDPVAYVDHETSANPTNSTMHLLDVASLPIAEGDLLVAHICADGGAGMAINCPIGWTQVVHTSHFSDSVFGAVCIKQADISDESATSYQVTTATAQQTQSGVILLQSHNPLSPIDMFASIGNQTTTSPQSPSLLPVPLPFSRVLRFMCANTGQVTDDVGFPAGMTTNLWIRDSADGLSGPVSGGAAIDGLGLSTLAEWTNVLATSQQTVNFTIAIAGLEVEESNPPVTVPTLSPPAWIVLVLCGIVVLIPATRRATGRMRYVRPEDV